MATYAELLQAAEDDTLNRKARIAVVIAADVVRQEIGTTPNHAARLVWASTAITDPITQAKRALWCALAQNSAAPLATILSATDAVFQTAINNAIDLLSAAV